MFLNKFTLTLKVLHKHIIWRSFLRFSRGHRRSTAHFQLNDDWYWIDFRPLCANTYFTTVARSLWVAFTLCSRFQLIFGFFTSSVHWSNCPQIQWFRVIRQFSCEHHKSIGFRVSPVRARLSVFGIWKLENGWLFSVHKSKSNSLECQFAALFAIPQCDPLRDSANRQQFPNWKLHN